MMSGRSCSITSRLAPVTSRRRSSTGASASVSRCAIPADGSSSRITAGCGADLAREVDDPPAAGGEVGDELVAELAESHGVDELVGPPGEPAFGSAPPVGACSAAVTGSQSASWSSSAMHRVWWTVSVPKSRAFWNDRARPEPRHVRAVSGRRDRGRRAGSVPGPARGSRTPRRRASSCPRRSVR